MIFLSCRAAAQEVKEQPDRVFYGGITLGANMAGLRGDAYDGYHKLGWNAGGLVHVRFLGNLAASAELLYSQKGCRGVREVYSNYVGAMYEKYYVDLNYVELPVQLLVHFKPRWNAGGGISYSRLLRAREELQSDQPYYIDPVQHSFNTDDWAFVLSGSYEFYRKWLVSFRYQQSLKPIRNPYYVPLGLGTGSQYNTYFTLRLIYLIP